MNKEILKIWISKNGDMHLRFCVPNEMRDSLGDAIGTALSEPDAKLSTSHVADVAEKDNEQ